MTENPYQPPSSDLQSTTNSNAGSIHAFPRFSAWFVVLLSIVTLGIYNLYWLWNRSQILNTISKDNPISKGFMQATIALWAINLIATIVETSVSTNPSGFMYSDLVNIAFLIAVTIWAFMFRSRLNRFLASSGKPHNDLGPILTLLFQVLYLAYKINQNIDLAQMTQSVTHAQSPADDDNTSSGNMQA